MDASLSGTLFVDHDAWIQAPLWTHDGAALIYVLNSKLYRLSVADGATPTEIPCGAACGKSGVNNDHVLSPDGTRLAVSSGDIWIIPVTGDTGGKAVQVTAKNTASGNAPSYAHSWSPDGRTIAYCAERDGHFDVYAIPATARRSNKPELKITKFAGGYNDGPDFSRSGEQLYFNSNRSGHYEVWRTNPDGAYYEQLTTDNRENCAQVLRSLGLLPAC